MAQYFPRPQLTPWIYAYSNPAPAYKGLLKVGYTTRPSVEERIKEQFNVEQPEGLKPYRIEFKESAMRSDGSAFTDKDVHRLLEKSGFIRVGESGFGVVWKTSNPLCCLSGIVWGVCPAERWISVCVQNSRPPWIRPPPTFKAYPQRADSQISLELQDAFRQNLCRVSACQKMGMKRVLVLTFKPAVLSAWEEDLATHLDFEGWQFIARNTELTFEKADKAQPIVCFGSFQDFLGVNRATGASSRVMNGCILPTGIWSSLTNITSVPGVKTPEAFEQEDDDSYDSFDVEHYDRGNACDEQDLPITTKYYLFCPALRSER